ncbi:DeoR/GlpR family transcriptional regulator [Vibrio lentus]|nr:DeoR/GlpR family transcriptional regulator [Vibrio lentus]
MNSADSNKIRRYHGGVFPLSSENTSYNTRKALILNEKDVIADELVKHIPDGANPCSLISALTPESVARALNKNHKTIESRDQQHQCWRILLPNPEIKVILAGGEVRNRDGGIVGEAHHFVKQFRLDFGILGISVASTLTAHCSILTTTKFEEIASSSRTAAASFLAVDHTKFGRTRWLSSAIFSSTHGVY